MNWFEDLLAAYDRPGRPLAALEQHGAWMLLRRESGVFRLVEKVGYSDSSFAYNFLESRPALLARTFAEGFDQPDGVAPSVPGRELWLAVDRTGTPDHLLIAELPAGVAGAGAVLRQALVASTASGRRSPGAAGVADDVDLPVWLRDMLPEMLERPGPLLILAEPGSGKEELVLAFLRSRFGGSRPAVFFHPGRLSEAVQLRELFGDPAGARLGGETQTTPIVERDEPAVVIQEAGDLAAHAQLRILARFSSGEDDLLWIFESSRDLERMAAAEKFLKGLYQMLEPGRLVLPPVRARRDRLEEEVGRLMRLFQVRYRRELDLTDEALSAILAHEWRGNWRELKNTLESAFLMAPGASVHREDLRLGLWAAPEDWDDLNLRRRQEEMEKTLLLRAYSLHGGNQVHMARALGISRGSLQYKLEKYGLN